jgi:hypothetical protein
MSYQQHVFTLIARLGGSRNKAVVDPTLCRFMGGLQGGVFLAQLLYWSDKGRGGTFYKSYKEWEDEIFLSKYEVNKAAQQCVDMGFLETEVRKANGSPTVHYTILPEKFMDKILSFVEMESQNFNYPLESEKVDEPKSNISQSFTETTYAKSSRQKGVRPTRAQGGSGNPYRPDEYADIII